MHVRLRLSCLGYVPVVYCRERMKGTTNLVLLPLHPFRISPAFVCPVWGEFVKLSLALPFDVASNSWTYHHAALY